jgi:hypothetical protein
MRSSVGGRRIRTTLETNVNSRILMISAALAATALAGCAYDSGPRGGGVAVGVTAGGPYYDAYYDDYYGPFNDGYWGDDGFFYYADTNRSWHRDDAHHFHRESGTGFHAVHGTGAHREH